MPATPRSLSRLAGLAAGAAAALAAAPASAERRPFTRTLDHQTQGEAETDLRLHSIQAAASFDRGAPQALALGIELVHGIARRADVAIVHDLRQASGATPAEDEPLRLDAIRVRGRYRVVERGSLPVDVVIAADGGKAFGAGAYQAGGRLVAARDAGAVTAAVNGVATATFGPDVDGTIVELGWAAGVTFEALPSLRIGAETWGGLDLDATDAVAAAVGPAVAWTPASSFWLAATVGFGISDAADAIAVGAILGLTL